MKKITTLLVDDEKVALNRMANLLSLFPNIEILHKEFNPVTAIEIIADTKPDIVFIDVEMPGMTGFDVVKDVREKFVFPEFVFVTAYSQYAIKAIKAETFDYLLKPVDIDDLRTCLDRFSQKQNHFPYIEKSNLTEREKEVACLLCRGKTSQEIADVLFISKHTADTHRRRILDKFGLKSTAELIVAGTSSLL